MRKSLKLSQLFDHNYIRIYVMGLINDNVVVF
jgi:hypothetical protein